MHFKTERIQDALEFIRVTHAPVSNLVVTGGGAYRSDFKQAAMRLLGCSIQPKDELSTLIRGVCYLVERSPTECYSFSGNSSQRTNIPISMNGLFPFMLCNIGSGVSIVRVDSPTVFERVSGTALGGGTFLGLCRLLTVAQNFEAAMSESTHGQPSTVNLLIEDIFGPDQTPFGLRPGATASFFAKAEGGDRRACDADVITALGMMITQNIAQIVNLNCQLVGLKRVFFTGSFLQHNDVAAHTIVDQMDRWNELGAKSGKDAIEVVFCHHDGYFGAVGSLLSNISAAIGFSPLQDRIRCALDQWCENCCEQWEVY